MLKDNDIKEINNIDSVKYPKLSNFGSVYDFIDELKIDEKFVVKNTLIPKMEEYPDLVNGIKQNLINYINNTNVSEYWDKLEPKFKELVGFGLALYDTNKTQFLDLAGSSGLLKTKEILQDFDKFQT